MKPASSDRLPSRAERARSAWLCLTDWLGARRPLDLVCGAVAIISALQLAGHLIFET